MADTIIQSIYASELIIDSAYVNTVTLGARRV